MSGEKEFVVAVAGFMLAAMTGILYPFANLILSLRDDVRTLNTRVDGYIHNCERNAKFNQDDIIQNRVILNEFKTELKELWKQLNPIIFRQTNPPKK